MTFLLSKKVTIFGTQGHACLTFISDRSLLQKEGLKNGQYIETAYHCHTNK